MRAPEAEKRSVPRVVLQAFSSKKKTAANRGGTTNRLESGAKQTIVFHQNDFICIPESL